MRDSRKWRKHLTRVGSGGGLGGEGCARLVELVDELGLSAQENRPKPYPVNAEDVQCSGETIEIRVIT